MKGATIRITDTEGHSITGRVIDTDDATEDNIAGKYNLVTKARIRHRPQWPNMANERAIYQDDTGQWISSTGQQITVEVLQPAAAPGPQLVKRGER